MRAPTSGVKFSTILLAASFIFYLVNPVRALGSDFGRLSGTVSDDHGNPLMGATVLIMGPMVNTAAIAAEEVERVLTDGKGKFAVEHLVPGWYSLQIVSPTRLPARRDGIKVEAGQTSTLRFVMGDVFAPLRFQVPDKGGSSLGEDWKWVLRASSVTRPILRYQQEAPAPSAVEPPLPASSRLVGVTPGSSWQDPLAGDPGIESVVAYLRHLSLDSDVLAIGALAANGMLASATGTEYRRGLIKGDPAKISLVLHQLGYTGGMPKVGSAGRLSDSYAAGLVTSYTQTRTLDPHLTLTAGMDINYLNALGGAMTAQPRMMLAYHLSRSTDLALQVGAAPSDNSAPLLDRVSMLDSFPQLTLRGYRPELEQFNHSEISLKRRSNGGSARIEIAAFQDGVRNAAVWGLAHPAATGWLAGNFILNPAGDGIFVNLGNYHSSGFRVAYTQRVGKNVEALAAYVSGDSLYANSVANQSQERNLQGMVRPVRSSCLAGRVSARFPATRTQLMTSYEWVERGRLTLVDPYGQAGLQLQPFLDVQVRQPLPAIAFLPSHIEAVAEFRNIVAQGYTPMSHSGETSFLLSPAYRSVRGGLSVEF